MDVTINPHENIWLYICDLHSAVANQSLWCIWSCQNTGLVPCLSIRIVIGDFLTQHLEPTSQIKDVRLSASESDPTAKIGLTNIYSSVGVLASICFPFQYGFVATYSFRWQRVQNKIITLVVAMFHIMFIFNY